MRNLAAALGVYFTSTCPGRSGAMGHFWMTKGESLVIRPNGFPFLIRTTTPALYPIGAHDLGPVEPFDVLKARTANQIQEPDALIYLTRTATDDEILGAYHGPAMLLRRYQEQALADLTAERKWSGLDL